MPDSFAKRGVLPLKILCNQIINVKTSECTDFEFIEGVLTKPCVSDFGGYNTKKMRESGKDAKHKTQVIYKLPTPSDPSTILTPMCDVEVASLKVK